MSDDIKQLLQPAVPDQVGTIDSHALVDRAMRQRNLVRVASIVVVVAVVVAAGSMVTGRTPATAPVVGDRPSQFPTAAPSGKPLAEVLAFDPGPAEVADLIEVLDLRVTVLGLDASTWVEDEQVLVGLHQPAPVDAVADALLQPSLVSLRLVLEEPGADPQRGPCQLTDVEVDQSAVLCDASQQPSPWATLDADGPSYLVGPGFWVTQPDATDVFEFDGPNPGEVHYSVSVQLSPDNAERFASLTSDAACARDRGEPGLAAIVQGPLVISTPGMRDTVICGTGITGGTVVIDFLPSHEQAQALATALRHPIPAGVTYLPGT